MRRDEEENLVNMGMCTNICDEPVTERYVRVHLGVCGQHVVPEDGGPAAGQLTDVGDDHDRQRHGLQHHHQHQ